MVKIKMPRAGGEAALDERIEQILDELSLAVRWQRPSLVTVAYKSELTRKIVETRLAGALQERGQAVLYYRVDRVHYDIPLELMEHALHGQAIFFVNNLSHGGGRGYSNAYRALNMHREYLVEAGIKAIFWLTEKESRQVARFAPDFWSFRHLVVAFPDLPATDKTIQRNATMQEDDLQEALRKGREQFVLGCYEDAIRIHRQALRKHPGEASICLTIAEIQLSMGQLPAAKRSLKQANRGSENGDPVYQKEGANRWHFGRMN
jgi:tetratricopeptide (TPR) repeat protein